MSKSDSEKILISNILMGAVLFTIIGVALIPNPPRIIVSPSFQNAEVEPAVHVKRSLGIFEVTAYCPCRLCCGQWADGQTANGHWIQPGDKFCAADPEIPFGKYLNIPGYGTVPVLDRGGKIKDKKLDVFFHTHLEALEWGRQKLEIYCWVERSSNESSI